MTFVFQHKQQERCIKMIDAKNLGSAEKKLKQRLSHFSFSTFEDFSLAYHL